MALPESLIRELPVFARRDKVLVASDFDGVLAPFADDPAEVRPVVGAIAALDALVARDRAVAVVSGRDLHSLTNVSGLDVGGPITLIGSHGAESSRDLELGVAMDSAARQRLTAATAALDAIAAAHPGVRIERKPSGVALHTRGLPPDRADPAAAAALAMPVQVRGVHAMPGKDVVELSVLSVSKGEALVALAHAVSADAVLYLGDDVTDETVFSVLSGDDQHVTVKVGAGKTAATHRVDGPSEAVEVLLEIARLRSEV